MKKIIKSTDGSIEAEINIEIEYNIFNFYLLSAKICTTILGTKTNEDISFTSIEKLLTEISILENDTINNLDAIVKSEKLKIYNDSIKKLKMLKYV